MLPVSEIRTKKWKYGRNFGNHKSFCLKPCWKKQVSFVRMACLFVLVSVSFQNEIFEGEHRRRPSVNRNSFSKEKNFLRSLGLLGNASQFLKWRLLLCKSSENILYHLKGEHVPKSTEQYLCASSVFFFISANKRQTFQPEALLKKISIG